MWKKYLKKLTTFLKSPKAYDFAKKAYYGLLLVVVVSVFYHVGYAQRIIPGVKIGDSFVGGMTYNEAKVELEQYLEDIDATLILKYGDHEHILTGDQIGLGYDVDATVTRAFELGRSGNLFLDTKDKIASLVKTLRVKAYYDVDDTSLSSEFASIKGEINQPAHNAVFMLEDGDLIMIPSFQGRKVSDEGIYNLVMPSIANLDFGEKEIPVKTIEPSIEIKHLEKVYSQVDEIISQPLTVTFEIKEWKLNKEQLLDFISVDPGDFGAKVKLNRTKFDPFLEILAQEIDKLPRGKVTRIEDNVVVGFELIEEGRELNRSKFTQDFKEAFLNGENVVEVEVNKIAGLNSPSDYGIFSLLGEGSSKFTGSANERIHNLTLAADRTNGVLVPPDGTYSFNNSVGEISGSNGYDSAYIIASGKTVLGEGGGVCQTSTTLFRSVLDAGLPIVVRHPHAYRVYYYEIDRPVGFDASIYQPSLDFQFKNDTPNHVLVQSEWDLATQTLAFKIYGTPDGRSVEITEPVVSGVTPPPDPLYQDDPNLPLGTTKQIDFEAWGASVYFSRTVTKGDTVLHEDTFNSMYQPWRAIYLVGTKES